MVPMKKLILFLIFLIAISCESDDLNCEAVLCLGRPALEIEFIDADSGEQLFLEVTDDVPEGLAVTVSNNIALAFNQGYTIVDGRLIIFQFPNETSISQEGNFNVFITADIQELPSSDCCPDFLVENIMVSGGSVEFFGSNPPILRITI